MVKLIALTKPVGELSELTPEQFTAYIARVSSPKNQMNHETAPKLLKYCLDHHHYSIFEHCYMTVEITTSRGLAAQILRHRSFVFQELSQRYSEVNDYIPYEARRQDKKNRQNSIDDFDEHTKGWFEAAQHMVWQYAEGFYKTALEKGIAKEQSRFLLPLNTKTTLFMSGNLRSWIHYVKLRSDISTQKEHREIALAVKAILMEQTPTVSEALGWTND